MQRRARTHGTQYVTSPPNLTLAVNELLQFYNLVLFMSSVALFSLVAQRMNRHK